MKPYPNYKDSGIEWLGEVPEHWEVLKGKRLFDKAERPALSEDGIITCFRDGQVTLRANRRTDGFTNSIKEIGYQGIRKGDLVIHNMDAFAGAIGVSDSDGKSTPVYSACIPKDKTKVSVFYYSYLLRNLALNGLILSLAKGIRERSTDFRFADFGNLEYYVPPLSEQQAIADFLDAKCEQIDRAVAQKERVIELLNERRQIIVQRAVTRGLNPNAPLKPSGIDWIGQIPKHWEVKRLKNCMKLNPSLDIENVYKDTLVSFMPMECLRNAVIIPKEAKYSDVKTYTPFRSEDIVMAKVTPCFENGNIAIANNLTNDMGFGSSEIFVIRCNNNTNNRFLFYYLQSSYIKNLGIASMTGTGGLKRVNPDDICRSIIFLPPLSEQQAIADYLDGVNEKIDKAINLKREEITRLKEYRQTLINSVVTGKVKIE